jgi:hypothetical protein
LPHRWAEWLGCVHSRAARFTTARWLLPTGKSHPSRGQPQSTVKKARRAIEDTMIVPREVFICPGRIMGALPMNVIRISSGPTSSVRGNQFAALASPGVG